MKKFLYLLVLMTLLAGCDNKSIDRPRDPWVFRSVLDQQPRIVTVMLHSDLYVAYDARYCGLYKAWKGDVVLDGPVYTTKHGPQPTSEGYAYFEQRLVEPAWRFAREGKMIIPSVQFKGYYFKEGQVTLRYELKGEGGLRALIEETPEFISQGDQTGLSRSYRLTEFPDDADVVLLASLTNLRSKTDYETNGSLIEIGQKENSYPAGTTITLDVTLQLNKNKETTLNVYYHPGFEIPEEQVEEEKDEVAQGATLIDGSDCRTCHNEAVKTIGPAYLDVAKKYDYTEANVDLLVGKIVKGGSGSWGDVAMTPHPDLMSDDAKKMVMYIMSLDGEEMQVADEGVDLNLDVNTVAIPFNDKNEFQQSEREGTNYPGLATMLYTTRDIDFAINETPKVMKPIMTAVAPAVHFKEDLFSENETLSENIYMQLNGFLNILSDDNYVLRLISDDGSFLYLDGKELINNDGMHGAQAIDGEVFLKKGKHPLQINYYQGRGGYTLSLQWAKHGDDKFSIIPNAALSHRKSNFKASAPYIPRTNLVRNVPGDGIPLKQVHPSFDLAQARPDGFEPRVGGMDFMSDSSLVICTWDSVGPVYKLEGVTRNDPSKIKVTRIAAGLAEPLGIKVVDDTIYVLQKQELTRLVDNDGDGIIDEYQTVCDKWQVSANFHEFAFGLEYNDGYFYATLATAIMPGGASATPQITDRGKAIKISRTDGSIEFIASGLRTPNGIGVGVDGELFIADNQGDWLPSSKILHLKEGAWYGSRSVDYEGTEGLTETPPVVWLPQDEIGNSPSQPVYLDKGPYAGQMMHGEVTHGGLKRVFVEKVGGEYQGAVFRFIQGLEGGVNRVAWGPDESLYVGMIGNPGNWGQTGKKWYGLQKLTYNGKSTFEMLAVRAKSNGIEIEMTEPLSERSGNLAADYEVKQWYYKPTENYGGPKMDEKNLPIQSVNISEDRKKIFLELKGMEENHVVYVRLKGIFVSQENHELWTTESWYTMNHIPTSTPGFSNAAKTIAVNSLTAAEEANGWKLLFDGKSTANWKYYGNDGFPPAWRVNDNALYMDPAIRGDGHEQYIETVDEYENFEFVYEWKIQDCGNSGVVWNVVDNGKHVYPYETGPEMQVLDNICHPDAAYPKHRAGDLYDMIECKSVTVKPAGFWNEAKIVSKNGMVEFWLNGYQIVTFTMYDDAWNEMVSKSKFKDWEDFGKSRKGHIALQDHGDGVWFRNLRIREL